ncbi:MAG: hypothetical protein RR061_01570 [Muribaculaceae bacterium]
MKMKTCITHKLIATLLLLLSLVYILMPIDFDGPIVGLVDDFFFFMAGFCYFITQFTNVRHVTARRQLNILSLCFLVAGVVWLCILAFTPLCTWVA